MSALSTTAEYIDAQQLAHLIQDSNNEQIMIVDVREADYTVPFNDILNPVVFI